jgi:hypothetical protein
MESAISVQATVRAIDSLIRIRALAIDVLVLTKDTVASLDLTELQNVVAALGIETANLAAEQRQ